MHGEFIGVWSETWRELWSPLVDHEGVPADIFCELYREISPALKEPNAEQAITAVLNDALQLREAFERCVVASQVPVEVTTAIAAFEAMNTSDLPGPTERRVAVEAVLHGLVGAYVAVSDLMEQALAELASDPTKRAEAKTRAREWVINDPVASRQAFEALEASELSGERAVVTFLEGAHSALYDLAGDVLANRFFNLLEQFIDKFSLRYDLRRPCTLCPTLPGVFASLMQDLQVLTSADPHLDGLRKDFEEAVRDLRIDCSDRRIRTCIQRQINLVEALGRSYPRVRRKTLGAISKQINSWPHEQVREALKSLYGFTCDYPGIRHSGTPANALRAVDMRDMVAVSILLAGFTPYLCHGINPDRVYQRA